MSPISSSLNDERSIRLQKLHALRDQTIDPYPAQTPPRQLIRDVLRLGHKKTVSCAGRIMSKRVMGKLTFCHIQDDTGRIQIVLKEDTLGSAQYQQYIQYIDIGDIIFVRGERFMTQKGEESVLVHQWMLLTKSLRPLPDKFHGLHDEDLRLRKRYLELLLDGELRDLFRRKARFWQSMRSFLVGEGFLEVETPVLETTTGGADATPFITHHHALDIDVYLRISNGELWQKRLMVAGFEKTFEMGRQFRNEGISREHLQDYSQMEFYWAYADYQQGMELVRRLYQFVIKETYGRLKFDIGEFPDIDFGGTWEEIDYVDTVFQKTGVNVLEASDEIMKQTLHDLNIEVDAHATGGRLMDLLWKYCRKSIAGPAFLIHIPVAVSPLAKRKSTQPLLTERYQIIVAGSELGNGYSELNDPVDQAERFAEQERMRETGDNEAQMNDVEFVEALEQGMPPTTGFGVSERLFSFLENRPIRECVLFPLVKPLHRQTSHQRDTREGNAAEGFLPLPMNRGQALQLLRRYHQPEDDITHYLESEAVMRALAKRLGQDTEYWGMLGLLHDIDWGMTKQNEHLHLTKAPAILREAGFPEDFIAIVVSHGYGGPCANLEKFERSREIEWALASAETVTGLVHAAARLRPDKIASLDVFSLRKKFKDKRFAAKVNRQVIGECEHVGLSLDEFLQLAIDAIRGIAHEVDLEST